MPMYDDTRKKLHAVVSAFHAASYPSLEVNYPGRFITDTEQTEDPYIIVEFTYRPKSQGLPARQCVTIAGELVLNHFARKNSGEKVFTDYTDALHTYLGLKTVSGVTFYEVNPYGDSGRPGFDGVMNIVNYEIDYFNV